MSTDRFRLKLGEQLSFIDRSCTSYDRGLEDESIRIATHLRVLFHDTKSSTSLLSHLGMLEVEMLSSARGRGNWKDFLCERMDLNSPTPVVMLPLLGTVFRNVAVLDWWGSEPVFVFGGKNYARKDIVLSIANKDGGAHVDELLEDYYDVLCGGEYTIGVTGNLEYDDTPPFPQGETIYPKNAHLALIRQFAHETIMTANYFRWISTNR